MKETNDYEGLSNLSKNNKKLINTPIGNSPNSFKNDISNEILYFSINQDSK